MVSEDGKLAVSTKFFYGFGSVAYGIKNNGFDYFLLFFYSQVVGLPAHLVGVGMLVVFVCDAISDPLVGHLSDNLHSRLGRRHPFMYASALPVALSYFMLWNPPQGWSDQALFIYFVLFAIAVRTFITFYEIPSSSLAPELSDDYDQRTSIMGYRYFFGWVGGLSISLLAYSVLLAPTPEIPIGQFNRDGYRIYGIIAAIAMFGAIVISSLGTHKYIPRFRKPPPRRVFNARQSWREFSESLSNRNIRILFLSAVVMYLGAGVSTNLNIYFNTFYWGFKASQIGIIMLGNFVAAFLALFLAPILARGREKKKAAIATWSFAVLLYPVPILLRIIGLFPEAGSPWLLPIMVVHSIVDVAAIIIGSIMVSSMVADVVEESERETGRRSEGIFFAARTFAQKVVNGLGTVGAGIILAVVGLSQGADPAQVDSATIRNLGLVFVPVWVGLYLLAMYILSFYSITRDSHRSNVSDLKAASRSAVS